MHLVTQDDIKEMNRLYAELKTYAAVGRATGFSASTVKKYIIAGYEPVDETKIIRFDKPIPELDCTIFRCNDWGSLCELSEEEIQGVKSLWKEMDI